MVGNDRENDACRYHSCLFIFKILNTHMFEKFIFSFKKCLFPFPFIFIPFTSHLTTNMPFFFFLPQFFIISIQCMTNTTRLERGCSPNNETAKSLQDVEGQPSGQREFVPMPERAPIHTPFFVYCWLFFEDKILKVHFLIQGFDPYKCSLRI